MKIEENSSSSPIVISVPNLDNVVSSSKIEPLDTNVMDPIKKNIQKQTGNEEGIFDFLKSDNYAYDQENSDLEKISDEKICTKNGNGSKDSVNNKVSNTLEMQEEVKQLENNFQIDNDESDMLVSDPHSPKNNEDSILNETNETSNDNFDPACESSVDMSYYSTNEELLTSVNETQYTSIIEPNSSIDRINESLDCSSLQNKTFETSEEALIDCSEKTDYCSLDDTDKTLMNQDNDSSLVPLEEPTIEHVIKPPNENNMVTSSNEDSLNCSVQTTESEFDSNGINLDQSSEDSEMLSNVKTNFSRNDIRHLFKEDDACKSMKNLAKRKSFRKTYAKKGISDIRLKSCEVQLGSARVCETVCKPNFLLLRRKLENMLDSAENEEQAAIKEIKRMKKEMSTIHNNIIIENFRIEQKIKDIE